MTFVLGLGYQARVGKDSVADVLVREHGWVRLSFADRLKELAKRANPIVTEHLQHLQPVVAIDGWEAAKAEHPETRLFLQRLGVAARDVLGPTVWINPVLNEIYDGKGEKNFVISDVRFRNEADALLRLAHEEWTVVQGAGIVKVWRPGVDAINDHVSERDLQNWPFDFVLDNDGTLDDLPSKVQVMLDALGA